MKEKEKLIDQSGNQQAIPIRQVIDLLPEDSIWRKRLATWALRFPRALVPEPLIEDIGYQGEDGRSIVSKDNAFRIIAQGEGSGSTHESEFLLGPKAHLKEDRLRPSFMSAKRNRPRY